MNIKLRNSLFSICTFCLLLSCSSGKNEKSLSFNEQIKLRQYLVQGESLYSTHCSNCHQQDGSGLRKLIPPLTANTYLQKNKGQLACIMKYGMIGEIEINATIFNEKMPPNLSLTNLEIAEISTYIGNNWGNNFGLISIDDVNKSLNQCNTSSQ